MNDPLAPLLAGAFVIVCGLLVKRFPMLISGYNTLPKEKRKNVDIDGLSSFMRRHLVIIGGLLILFTTILDRKSTRLNSSHPSSSRMPSSA